MNILNEISFEYPLVFLLFIVFLFCEKYCKKQNTQIYFSNILMLEKVIKKQNSFIKILKYLFVFFLLSALASPISKENITLEDSDGYEILLSIDASDSMKDENRFKITKEIVADFIDKRKYDRLALCVFAEYAYMAVPFTYDKEPLKDILSYLEIGVAGMNGTALYEALYLSGKIFEDSKAKNKIVILLTDGINTNDNMALDIAIQNAKKYALKVYTVAIGDKREYQGEVLEKIAKETGAKFFETSNLNKLKEIYEEINSLEKSKIQTSNITKTTYYFQYVLVLALFIFMFLYFINRGKI